MATSLFERPQQGERALLVHVEITKEMIAKGGRSQTQGERESKAQEFLELASSAGAEPVDEVQTSRYSPDSRFFVGSGKAEEIAERVKTHEIDLVLFDQRLSPSQERNLEKLFQCRVLDRTGLILDIFAQRARSFEGKLQVELAQLKHISTRLIRGWTHLERQKGGIGMRGPGESQLETDRRLIGQRIKLLERRLAKVSKQRQQSRASRQKAEVPTVSLVGYTNAGKSTLFNKLTDAGVYAKDQLFATLDPTLRQLILPNKREIVLADTVGFIRDLPHDLVAAFRSTLQETEEAHLLLHVIDSHDPERDQYIHEVNDVLAFINADVVPQLCIYNKIDLDNQEPYCVRNEEGIITQVHVSAHTGEGMDLLMEALEERLADETYLATVTLQPSEGKLRAQMFALGIVSSETINEQGHWCVTARLSDEIVGKLGIHADSLCKHISESVENVAN